MPSVIEIHHVPDVIHTELAVRAARSGLSLSDYVLRELERLMIRPTTDELVQRIRSRPAAGLTRSQIVTAVREHRDRNGDRNAGGNDDRGGNADGRA